MRAGTRGHRLLLMGSVLLALVLIGAYASVAGPSDGGGAPQARVEIKDFAYQPATLTVRTGTTVTWINHDDELHTVTASAGRFASPGLEHDETFFRRFAEAGTYTYFCALHPRMTATIIVQ